MTKRPPLSIGATDIDSYLASRSDFVFELQVLKLLLGIGLKCSHGGTYDDPVKSVPRQFDIRAYLSAGVIHVDLTVECKALSTTKPLVVLSIPRACYALWKLILDRRRTRKASQCQLARVVVRRS